MGDALLMKLVLNMMNFMNEAFSPHIVCDKPCSDNYDVTNLIVRATNGNHNGFRAEYFIKAPLCVTIKFPFNINISHIKINPTVGCLKSLGFQVFTQYKHISETPDSVGTHGQQYVCFNNGLSKKSYTRPDFGVCIGNVQLNEAAIICFINNKYNGSRILPEQKTSSANIELVPLRHHLSKPLSCVSHVTFRITKTFQSCTPAIKLVEIWGRPSLSCSRAVVDRVQKLHSELMRIESKFQHKLEVHILEKNNCDKIPCAPKNFQHIVNNINIPEEFIDPITCEIMAIPVLLPSGKTIDTMTLERHVNVESNWGRQANDPFTGILFTPTSKPNLHTALKSRIDQYLLQHSDRLIDIPRTLGHGSQIFQNYNITKTNQAINSSDVDVHIDDINQEHCDQCCDPTQKSRFPVKRSVPHDFITDEAIKCKNPKLFTPRVTEDSSEVENKMISNCAHSNCHEPSLESSLAKALAGRPSFTQSNSYSDRKTHRDSNLLYDCAKCQRKGAEHLYRLPCDHAMCRECLHEMKESIKCTRCYLAFTRRCVVKLRR